MAGLQSRTLLAAFVVIAVAPTFAQQPAAPTTLTLRGVVVTANDVPLPRVRVAFVPPDVLPATLAALPELERAVLTDERGQFAIAVPSAAAVRLAFTKARYAAQTADIPPRELTAQPSEIRVRLSLAGAISGQVLDRSGARVMSVSVTLQRVGAAPTAAAVSTDTNDLGEFRFGGLAEGTYAIAAKPSMFALSGPIADRQATVNALAVEGPIVRVGRGDEVGNVTLTIDPPSELVQRIAGVPDADPEATASLSGRVVGPDGLPIVRAVVRAMRQGMAVRNVETDARGRYVIDRLATGDYIVEAQKYGYINRQYGQDRIASIGRRVSLQKDQAVGSIDVTLPRGGAIAGTIVDELGEPVQGAAISALQLAVISGRTRALRASTFGPYKTDDRGQYRLFGMQPGTYVVQATIGDTLSATTGYVPQFYPGTSSIDQATPTKVDLNAAASGINLTLIPTTAHRVTGVVLDSSGKPARASLLLAVSERSGAIQTEPVRSGFNPADGSFVFTNVGPGDYVVQAEAAVVSTDSGATVTSGRLFASSFLTVTAGDPPPMSLTLSAGATLVGHVRYEGVPAGPPPNFALMALPTDFDRGPLMGAGPRGFSIQPDGSFEYRAVFGPTLLVAQLQRNDWYLKSIMFKGQDLTDSPFDFGTGTSSDIEVLISAFGAATTGRVTDERLAPVRDYSVILFSTFSDKWFAGSRRVKTARPDQDGAFSIVGLPPGDYWIVAVDRLDSPVSGATVPPDPALLESLSSRALRVTLGEGQSQDLTLRLIRR